MEGGIVRHDLALDVDLGVPSLAEDQPCADVADLRAGGLIRFTP